MFIPPITPTPGKSVCVSDTLFDFVVITDEPAFFFHTRLVSASELAKLSLKVRCCSVDEQEVGDANSCEERISSSCRKSPEAVASGSDRCDLEPKGRRDEDDEASIRYCAGDDGIEK